MLLKLGKSPDWCATPCSYAYFTYLYTLVCFLLSHVARNRSRVYSLSHRYAFPFIPVSRCLLYTNLFKSSKILWAFYDAISCKAWLAYCSFRLKVPITWWKFKCATVEHLEVKMTQECRNMKNVPFLKTFLLLRNLYSQLLFLPRENEELKGL